MKNKWSTASSRGLATWLFRALGLVLVATHVNGVQAQTQYGSVVITPPIVDAIDENFVSMFTGKTQFTIPALQLGDVSFVPFSAGAFFWGAGAIQDQNYGSVVACLDVAPYKTSPNVGSSACATTASASVQVIYGQERATFVYGSGTYSSYDAASTFVDNVSVNGTCTWTQRDGTQIIYYGYHVSGTPVCQSNNIYQVVHPDGRIATYYYYALNTQAPNPSPLLSIATNRGYLLKYNYSGTPTFGGETSVTAINRAFETCDPAAISCSLANSWPTATLTFQNKPMSVSDGFSSLGPNYNPYLHYLFTLQDAAHRQHIFELDSYWRVISYQPPQATTPVYSYTLCTLMSDNTTLTHCFGLSTWNLNLPSDFQTYSLSPLLWDAVNNVTRIGNVWNYLSSATQGTMTPPDPTQTPSEWSHSGSSPLGVSWAAYGNATPGTEYSFGPIDEVDVYDGTVYHYERDISNNLFTVRTKAGILTQEGYDVRANLQNSQKNPIAGSGLAPIVQSAIYPPTCTNAVTCNRPTSAQDANGNQYSFTYDPAHGGVLTVTGPAVNGVQPQARKTYIQRFAWYYNSAGTMTRETHPIWLLATESSCISGAWVSGASTLGSECALPNDELDTVYDYGPDSGPNNLRLLGMTVTSGGVTLRTCYGYDSQGNKIWETSPNANLASCTGVAPPAAYLTAYTYAPGGLLTGTISPAPTGQSNFQATRNSYDANGRLQTVEKGVLTSWPSNWPLATGWGSFNATTTTRLTYDGYGNKAVETLEGSDHAITHVTQYAYDTYNRLTCTAERMNPAAFGSLPGSACTLGAAGSNGPDRITQNFYDSLNRVTQIQRAVGTSLVENYRTNTYTDDGLLQSVSDAKNNLSHFNYDGLDRLQYSYFPSPTSAGNYNTADFEQFGYDQNGDRINRTSLRKRDGQTISYSYDALNRMSTKTEPVASLSVTYGYDLRGLQTSAVFTTSGKGITSAYDGFGRRVSSTNTMGATNLTVSRLYDSDGDLIRVTHPDGNYFKYIYDGADRFTGILENGGTSIVGQSYFPNGLRSTQSRGAVTTSYGYQPDTLLASITDPLAGTAAVTTTFAYNPAGQLTSRMRTNDAYAVTAPPIGNTAYTPNGLNQYTNVGGAAVSYDGRGNLYSDGTTATTYTYDAENHLLTASGAHNATLTYDPLGRLYQVASAGNTTQFLYDGDALVAEYDGSGAVLHRYVHGPQVDDPLIWYQGTAVSSTTRRSLQVDHQGSIVSLADVSGAALTINIYDEYGAPAPGNAGRFQYTGQAWLSELGLYYYKARVYDPRLGRFLQTDPVGYRDDLNLYAYVAGDPLDQTDPAGTEAATAEWLQQAQAMNAATSWGEPGEATSFILDSLPVIGEYRAISDFIDHPSWMGAAIIGASVVDVGAVVKGATRQGSKIDRAAFRAEREAFWKAEAKNNPGKYSAEDLAKMEKGRAPTGADGHPMELHHKDRTPNGGVEAMSRTDHRLGENYKKNHPEAPPPPPPPPRPKDNVNGG